ncbi:hypothetical protein [Roseibium sp. Sym1]|uniref:hypothetical protein n=1 Tax=Roseibium sp. Sym1 TaxID=3016006 RepID=UPI0022B58117|nr:hypothetical protein [Roseibium sp. Sym1]
MRKLIVFCALLFLPMADPSPGYAQDRDDTVCPFAPEIESKIAKIGPLSFRYCEGFGRHSAPREFLVGESELYLNDVQTIENEIEEKTGKISRVIFVYNEKPNRNLDKFILDATLGLDRNSVPATTALRDRSTGETVLRLSHYPKSNTDYFYFQEDGDPSNANAFVICNLLSEEPSFRRSKFKFRSNDEPVYRRCYFRIRYEGSVMIDAEFYDVMWNELAEIKDSLTDTLDRLVVR